MAQRPPRPAGYGWVSPYLTVRDPDAAIDFYQRAFGFEKKLAVPMPNGKTGHAEVTYRDAVIMMGPENDMAGPCRAPVTLGTKSPVAMYVYCDDVDALYARATAAGGKGEDPPKTQFYGDRTCRISDPDGHVWYFATNVADFDPANAPK